MNYHVEINLVGKNSLLTSAAVYANSWCGNLAGMHYDNPIISWIQSVTQVPESWSMILGVICAIIGWWAVEQRGAKKSETSKISSRKKSGRSTHL